MPKKTRLKDLLITIGIEKIGKGFNMFMKETASFKELVERISGLKKEVKKLMKQNLKQAEMIMALIHASPDENKDNIPQDVQYSFAKMPPVAEYQCAEGNIPNQEGRYSVIVKQEGQPTEKVEYHIWLWLKETGWGQYGHLVVAFTETDPKSIADALKKQETK